MLLFQSTFWKKDMTRKNRDDYDPPSSTRVWYFGTPTYFRSLKPPDLPVLYGWKGGRNKDTASAEK